ncbi:hypothetical protein [Massilia sp. S19_KUP03_FR1]|uniref:hypothetical protein n=1 Tax=Massilia sp. S19_KUP03_FR1 TaxID=3025503 RepID=UPI002FCD19B4
MSIARLPMLALIAAILPLGACANGAPALGSKLSLSERQSITVVPGAILTYDSVSDSRCPPDVQCVVAGKVVYSFTLKQGDTLEHFTLSPAEPDYVSPVLQGKHIVLAETAPAPKAQQAGASHPVSIKVVAP